MTSDKERIHRWLTEAELDAMLEAARQEGRAEVERLRHLVQRAAIHLGLGVRGQHVEDTASQGQHTSDCPGCFLDGLLKMLLDGIEPPAGGES